MKYHLKRVLGDTILIYKEMATLLTQVEAVFNSRPLSPLSDDLEDLHVLTSSYFLIGSAPAIIPEPLLSKYSIHISDKNILHILILYFNAAYFVLLVHTNFFIRKTRINWHFYDVEKKMSSIR